MVLIDVLAAIPICAIAYVICYRRDHSKQTFAGINIIPRLFGIILIFLRFCAIINSCKKNSDRKVLL